MSEANEVSKDLNVVDNDPKVEVKDDPSTEEVASQVEKAEENPMPSPAQEEAVIKKKYGGLLPRKTPLISKDHDRAFFDSADWALGKGSQKSKGPLEALRPKLQPTPHHQARSRRSSYAPADEGEVDDGSSNVTASEDQGTELDMANDEKTHSEDQSHPN
ncbi:endosulphine [Artemisia annua]|uniref:Endosulphine n=1 Tax=Artemisia annua TaxID=35608 RepID=A0A2U1N906_ARTAN|nr:endosulphine [Artemisia annua]